jgi:hypothetical protein
VDNKQFGADVRDDNEDEMIQEDTIPVCDMLEAQIVQIKATLEHLTNELKNAKATIKSKSVYIQTEVTLEEVAKLYSKPKLIHVQHSECSLDGKNSSVQVETKFFEERGSQISFQPVMKSKKVEAKLSNQDILEEALKSDKACMEQCGIARSFLLMTEHELTELKSSRAISKIEKLLLFFMKLRYNDPFTRLGRLFHIHRTTASEIFHDVLGKFYSLAKDRLWWFSRAEIDATMPESFKRLFPKTRVIIDASEVVIENTADVDQAVLSYSQYKSRHTLKYLLGISPRGLISFISKAYGGRTTDGQITASSGLYDLLEPGDEIMSDKGFPSIEKSLIDRHAIIVMPPFRRKGVGQFSEADNKHCYNVASVRIHVERAIGRMKQFKVLHFLENSLLPDIDRILVSISYICNDFPPLIKE